jgi:spermidine/putrescine-binding protein
MTKKEKTQYEDVEVLRALLLDLQNRKFTLDCGHHFTLGYFLGNNIIIYNGKKPKIICTQCGY